MFRAPTPSAAAIRPLGLRIVPLLFLILAAGAVAEPGFVVEVIPLQGRTVEELLPMLRPLAVPGASVTGLDSQLVIRTTPENLKELKGVLARIDTPLRRLRITVEQGVQSAAGGSGLGVGDGVVDEDGLRTNVRVYSTGIQTSQGGSYFVETIEGQPALIQMGQSRPLVTRSVTPLYGGGAVVQENVVQESASSGFYVRPRLNGADRVTLEILPGQSAFTNGGPPGAIQYQEAQSTVQGRLGEWIEIGGVNASQRQGGSGILYSTGSQQTQDYSVRVKVEER